VCCFAVSVLKLKFFAITYLLFPAAAYIATSCVRVNGGTRTAWKLKLHGAAYRSGDLTAPRCPK
jgi:hypothetical protein